MTCVVRNFTAQGAMLGFNNTATVPDKFDLVIGCKQRSFRARMVWRRVDEAGVVFEAEQAGAGAGAARMGQAPARQRGRKGRAAPACRADSASASLQSFEFSLNRPGRHR